MPWPEHNNDITPLLEYIGGNDAFRNSLDLEVPVSVTPPGWEVKAHEYLLERPTRIRRTQAFSTLASFRAYLDENAQESTTVYCRMGSLFQRSEQSGDAAQAFNPYFTAIIDDDCAQPKEGIDSLPSWRSHQATFQPLTSDQMRRWFKSNRQLFNQKAFAEFIEDNIADIVGEDGAKLLQAATMFESSADITMKSHVRLDNGMVEYTYSEKESDKVGKVRLPARFIVAIPMYYGSERAHFVCRLKYRAAQGGVHFFYEIENGGEREIQMFNSIVTAIKGEGDKAVRVYEASAPIVPK